MCVCVKVSAGWREKVVAIGGREEEGRGAGEVEGGGEDGGGDRSEVQEEASEGEQERKVGEEQASDKKAISEVFIV